MKGSTTRELFSQDPGLHAKGAPRDLYYCEPSYADYSHGVRLVHPVMTADGQSMAVADVLAHPVLHALLSNEGPVRNPRIPATRSLAANLADQLAGGGGGTTTAQQATVTHPVIAQIFEAVD